MWKLVCAMAVSTGIFAFPFAPSRKGSSLNTFDYEASKQSVAWGSNRFYPFPFQSFPQHTRCEAVAQSEILEGESSYEKMAIPERGFHEGHVIFGVLLGENMIESYDVFKRPEGSNEENVIIAHVRLGNRIDGHKGVVHGGILSLIFDDVLGYGFEALGVNKAFTANLTVDFRAPVPAGTMIRVQAQLEHREGRKLFWKAQMTSMDGEILFAECSSLFIIPRSHA